MEPGRFQRGQGLPRVTAALQLTPGPFPGTCLGWHTCRLPKGSARAGRGLRGSKQGGLAPAPALPRKPFPFWQPPQVPPALCPFRTAHCAHLSHLCLSPHPLPGYLQLGLQASAPKSLPDLSRWKADPPCQPCTQLFSVPAPTLFICLSVCHRASSPQAGPAGRSGSQLRRLPESVSVVPVS